ncbi:hypothetical protein TNCV_3883731 [Trichonephila clavipes]|nr:hypothetical protein TNCV_3883731 [Trichonephila clavipes]
MAVCKCLVPLRHGVTLNSCGAENPHVRLGEGEKKWLPPFIMVFFLKLVWNRVKSFSHLYDSQSKRYRQAYI